MQKYHIGCGCRMMALRSHTLCGDVVMVGVRCCFMSGCSCQMVAVAVVGGMLDV